MRVLLADKKRKGDEAFDFYWCENGELLHLGMRCARDDKDDISLCGCSRAFTGVQSVRATTIGIVADLPADEVANRIDKGKGVRSNVEEGWPWYTEMVAEQIVQLADTLDELGAEPGQAFRVDKPREGGFTLLAGDNA